MFGIMFIQTFVRRGSNMERTTEFKTNVWVNLLDNVEVVRNRPKFKVYPQMPGKQIQHFVAKASESKVQVAVQLNESPYKKEFVEVIGTLKVSPKSSHVILSQPMNNAVHLIQPKYIRHIRVL